MRFKRLFLLGISTVFLLTTAGKPIVAIKEIGENKENVTKQIIHLAKLAHDEATEDPEEILSRAIEDYKEEFDDYINITAFNVLDKQDVNLPNFDINYIAPTYAEVMNEYQINLEASLTPFQLEKYDLLRQRDYNFDKYVALNQNKLCQESYYFSTYTWYNNTAKNMLYDSAPSYSNYGDYGYNNLVYHKFTNMKRAVYGWNHYHVGKYNPSKGKASSYPDSDPIHAVHSFFGLTYIRLDANQGFMSFPANP